MNGVGKIVGEAGVEVVTVAADMAESGRVAVRSVDG